MTAAVRVHVRAGGCKPPGNTCPGRRSRSGNSLGTTSGQVWDQPEETAVADAVQRLLAKANNGPPQPGLSARDRRVAARTAATSENRPVPRQQPPDPEPDIDEPQPGGKVIPLRVFDPAEEARRPW
jgi:hypothetical protein